MQLFIHIQWWSNRVIHLTYHTPTCHIACSDEKSQTHTTDNANSKGTCPNYDWNYIHPQLLHWFFAIELLFKNWVWRVQVRSNKPNNQKYYKWHWKQHDHRESSSLTDKFVLDEQPEDEIDSQYNYIADYLGCTGSPTKRIQFLVLFCLLSHLLHYTFE